MNMNMKMNSEDVPSPPSSPVRPASTAVSTTFASRSQASESWLNTSGFGASYDPRIPSQQASARTQIGNSRQEMTPQRMQRLGGYRCPDVALLDSEIAAGDLCDRRLSASSWQSDYNDADDYDKENQCVYRENIDSADNIYGLTNTDNELGLFLSPAFSEDSMHPTTANTNPASFGIQSY
jgi:hypothetical protein